MLTLKGGSKKDRNIPLAQTMTEMSKTFDQNNQGSKLFEGKVEQTLGALQGTLDLRSLAKVTKVSPQSL